MTFQNIENGWTVLKVRECDKNLIFSAVGTFNQVFPGETFMIFGKWVTHASFGRQFLIERAVSVRPTQSADLVRYLSSGMFKGIGPKIAGKIVKHFGENTLKILDENPQKLKTIPKFSKKLASKFIEAWSEKNVNSEAMQFLSHHGISLASAQKIIKEYGKETVSIISQNPYCLMRHIKGFGFLRADEIGRAMGIAPDAPQRIEQGILYVLKNAEDFGHCFQSSSQIYQTLAHSLMIKDEEKIEEAFRILQEKSFLISKHNVSLDEESDSETCYFLPFLYEAEEVCAEVIVKLLNAPMRKGNPETEGFFQRVEDWLEKFCKVSARQLSSEQREAVVGAVSSKVFILTGGPGVGKTTTANAIIQLLKAMGKKVVLGAPTGRAAQRMTELSSLQAKTIHRLLEWSSESGGFIRGEDNKLEADVIIIDESSMLDIQLAQHLLLAIPESAQLILIGDKDQLPPVGPGNFFRDLIESKQIPLKQLDRIFRQAKTSHIVSVAHDINHGKVSDFSHPEESDCHFMEVGSDEEVLEKMKKILTVDLTSAGYNTLRDVQILSPMNKGLLGCQNLNQILQDLLNPCFKEITKKNKSFVFRVKDKVIQTVNNYELTVYNGDIGYVESITDKKDVIVRFGERYVKYSQEQSNDLKLAYAITIHKSQGSEFPVVILPMTMGHYVMLQRNLIYTGLTRAKKLAVFLGSKKAFAHAARNRGSQRRQTRLKTVLRQLLSSPYFAEISVDGIEEGIG